MFLSTIPYQLQYIYRLPQHGGYEYTIKKVSNNTSAVNIQALQDEVAIISVTNGGTGYTISPIVTIAAPTTGTTATATATINVTTGLVTSISITDGGSGYTAAPIVTIAAPTTGTIATATASINGGNVENQLSYALTVINQGIKVASSGTNWYIMSNV